MLQSGLSTRTAKPGDSVYFQTIYPVARNNRIVIPMGSFVRGEVVSAKPAGRLKGRAELLIRMNLLTFSNGYTVDLAAIPASLSESSRLFVEDGGKIAAAPGKAIDPASAVGAATLAGLALGTYGGLIGSVSTGSPHALGAGVAAGGGTGLLTGVLVAVFSHGPEAELRPGTTVDAILNHPVLLSASQLPPSTSGVAPVQSTAAPRSEKSPRRCCGLPRPWSFFRP
jgi:type IV secretion system protein VirB10